MSISFVAQANNVANAASITINTPAGVQAGDLLIAAIYNGSASDTITTPAGWNLLGRWADSSINRHLTIFWKMAGPSEPTSTTFTGSANTRRAGFIAAYRGVNQANPWDVYAAAVQTAASTLHTTPTITPNQDGCMIVGIVGLSIGTSSAPPAGWTERVDRGTTDATITEADILQSTAQAISGTFTTPLPAITTSIKFIGALAPRAAYQRRVNGNALGLATASAGRRARRQASAQALLTGTAAPSQVASRQASGAGYGAATANSTLAARRAASGLALGQTTASTAYAARRTSLAQGYGSSTASIGLRFDRQIAFASLGQSQGASSRAARRAASGAGLGYANADASAAYRRGGSYFGLGLAGAEQTRATPRRLLAAGNAASSSVATRAANRRVAVALEAVAHGAFAHRTAWRRASYLLSLSPQADALRYVRRTTTLYGILGSTASLSISRTYDDFVTPQYYTYSNAPWYTPEVALAAGPHNVGDTGDGSYTTLHGYAYVGAIVDGVFRLWQLHNASGLPYSLAGDSPVGDKLVGVLELPLPEGARHLALAFDQAAREVIAYEVDGQTYVRQWDPVIQQYTLRGPFPGVDPVLINDATVGYFPPDSDVLLFHLTPDRKTLIMRVQRELYNTPHTIQTFETPVVLDQAVALPYQIELLGSLAGILDATGYVLRSELYPAYLDDTLGQAALVPPSEGAYIPIVITQDLGTDLLGTATLSAPTTGACIPIVIVLNMEDDLGQAQLAAPTTGAYALVVLVYDLGMDVLGQAQLSAPTTGAYALVVVVVDTTTQPGYTSPDVLGTATLSAPTTGAYEPA